MPYSWVRPESSAFPQVYKTFELKSANQDENEKFVIQDLEENQFDQVIELMKSKHIFEEPMYSSKGVGTCPISSSEMVENWRNMLNQKISLVCYKEDKKDEIVAVNVIGVVHEYEVDAPHNYKGEGWVEVNNLKKFVKNIFFNPFEHYQVDKLMFAAGLYVNEKFRGRGIATEMIKAREPLGISVGIEVSSNVFSSLAAQKAALAAGYDESFSIKYSNLAKLTPDGFFLGIRDEFMKIMSKKFY